MAIDKFLPLTSELMAYVIDHSDPADEVMTDLTAETRELGRAAGMQIAPDVGPFLGFLVQLMGAKQVVEIGTFTGSSSLWMARAMGSTGHVHCFDRSDEWTSIARAAWARAGVADRITLHIGPALERLTELPEEPIDLAFVDADKTNYENYIDWLLPRLGPGGVIVVDNVLWGGRLLDASIDDPDTEAIRTFNNSMSARPDVNVTMLTVGDGLSLITRTVEH